LIELTLAGDAEWRFKVLTGRRDLLTQMLVRRRMTSFHLICGI